MWLLALLTGGGACRNACQDICTRMADYATECGYPVSDAEIDACIEGQSAPGESRSACREFGDPEVIRTQWSCEDLSEYWAPKT
ncbi:MAG: hypothetical protein ABMA64_01845 [Myxococcota bacterium]